MAAAAPSQLTSAAASSASSSSLSSASGQLAAPRHVALFLASQALAALAVLLKERIFKQAHVRLGRSLDLFVVNTGASAAQAAFVLLLLPLYASTRGVPLSRVPDALLQGVQCFAGLAPSCGSDCSGAPLLPASYLAVNIALNICALFLLRSLGSLAASLSTAVMVPLTIAAFALLPLPYLVRTRACGGRSREWQRRGTKAAALRVRSEGRLCWAGCGQGRCKI